MAKKTIKSVSASGVNMKPASNDPTKKLGVTGTSIYGGFVTSPEKNSKLQGTQKYTTYSNMFSNLSIVAAGVRYFLNVITKSAWKIEPSDNENNSSIELAEFVNDVIHDLEIPWHRVIRKAVMYKFYGFSIMEWTAKMRSDGKIGLLAIESRPQKTIEKWDVDDKGTLLGIVQRSPQTSEEIYIPRGKFIYIVDDSLSDSPEGYGLFRHLVEPSNRLQRYEQLEGYGYETDLRGIPVGRAPLEKLTELVDSGAMTKAQMETVLEPMTKFITEHVKGPKLGILLDSVTYQATNDASTPSNVKTWDIELLKGGSDSLKEIATAIQRLSGEIARILGVEGLLLGSGKGSQALSRDKSDNFFMVVDGALKELAATFNHELIPALWELNGFDPKLMPSFKTDSLQLRDIEQITSALKDMAQAGAVLAPDDPAIGEIRDLLGLSRPLQTSINDLAVTDNEDNDNIEN